MEKYDLIVIGGGPGGYPAAIRAAQMGARVALVERELLGGTCLNWGCIPTKTMLASAGLLSEIQDAAEMGLLVKDATVDYAALLQRKQQVVAKLRGGIGQLLQAYKVKVYQGHARLLDRRHVEVQGADAAAEKLETDYVVIAAGAQSARPGSLPDHARVYDSRAFLDLPALPRSLIVMGGGIIGCELACLAAQLGAQVTVVELLDDILQLLDRDVRMEVRRHMERRLKIKIITGGALEQVVADEGGVSAVAGGEKLQAEGLLVAVGRKPCSSDLGLERVGLTPDERGFIEVDENCRTRAANIFAVGDINGGPQLAHAATNQGTRAVATIMSPGPIQPRAAIPSCIFTAPEVGTVGLTEQEAAGLGLNVNVGKFVFTALGKALAANVTAGFVKWVTDAGTGQILGAQAVGAHATELIAEATLAVQQELTISEVAGTVHAHPTLSEAWMEAAHVVAGHCVHAPPARPRKRK
ncbi:MAG: dihydrolipoyl dehydrogenase [Kiritimatiellia bacterium]|nr:dihydrolipoyl dehydrogenase [Lentisphaerota bacterium]